MPANSFGGNRAITRLVSAEASFDYDRSDTYAACVAIPRGGTSLLLPDKPTQNDFYAWANPDNSAGPGTPILLSLSAEAIAAGVTIQGLTAASFDTPGTSGMVVFFEEPSPTWQVFLSATAGGVTPDAAASEIVWRPGAARAEGIAGTWADVAAAIADTPVPLTVFVDSFASAAIIPGASGVTDCLGTTTFKAYNRSEDAGSPDTMTIGDGATLHRPRAFSELLKVVADAVTTAALSFDTNAAGIADAFTVDDNASFQLGVGALVPAVLVPAGGLLLLQTSINATLSSSAAAGVPLIELAATAVLQWGAYSILNLTGTAPIAGSASATVVFLHDDTIPLPNFAGFGFAGTVTETRTSLAAWAQPSFGATGARPAGANVVEGQIFYDSTVGALLVWSGTAWIGGPAAFVSVKAFGALGDGITNDGPAIQVALTALAGTGTSLWFPAGTYVISSAVIVPAGVTMWVAGAGGRVVNFSGGFADPVANQALVYGATPGTAAFNPTWFALASIFINPATGNDQAAGDTSGAPLKTWAEVIRRYGSTSPTLQVAALTFTFQGVGHTDDSDPVVFNPICFRGVSVTITGSLTQVWSGAATLVAAKNRATPQLLDMTLPAGAAANQLVINTSRSNATAFVYKASAGNWLLSQPMAIPAVPFGLNATEDNGWTTGNVLTGNTTTAINLVELRPVFPDSNGPLTNGLYVTRCTGLDPVGNSALLVNDGVIMGDAIMGRRVLVASDFAGITPLVGEGGCTNCNFTGGVNVTAPTLGAPLFWYVLGGIINNATFGISGSSYALDADVIMVTSSNNAAIGLASMGLVFFDTGASQAVSGSSELQVANQLSFGGPVIWGPGGRTSVLGTSHMSYPTGVGGAVATFTQTVSPSLCLNAFSGATNGHSVISGAPDVFNGGISITPAHLDAAAGVAGFGGVAFNPGGASISNLVN